MDDNNALVLAVMRPEYMGSDPYFHGKTADIHARNQRELKRLSKLPAMAQPILNFIWRVVYRTYWQAFQTLIRLGNAVAEQLRVLANY